MESPRRILLKESARSIRQELKRQFPQTKFSVRLDRYSMGEAIDIRWTDGVATEKVEAIASKYEDISRDERTGEILSGGNRYVQCHRHYSDEAMKQIENEIKGDTVIPTYSSGEPNMVWFRDECWRRLVKRDF